MPLSKKAFITGITGFVGRFLTEHLQAEGYAVAGVDRDPVCGCPGIAYFEGDILDTAALAEMVASVNPQRIFHLAALSSPAEADTSPRLALDINIMGAASLLEAARQACPSARVLLVGSSKQYRDGAAPDAIAEGTACGPSDFYGVSKFAAELIGLQYVKQYGLDVRCTRSFNHTGPGQSPRFVCSDWAGQVAKIELGMQEPGIHVGSIHKVMDFCDVRDVVRAYHLVLEKGGKGTVYNVCSGTGIALTRVLEILLSYSSKKITVVQDKARLPANAAGTRAIGDCRRITAATGWRPEIPIERTLGDLYRYWLAKLKAEAA